MMSFEGTFAVLSILELCFQPEDIRITFVVPNYFHLDYYFEKNSLVASGKNITSSSHVLKTIQASGYSILFLALTDI